jgi:hypothetical protein
VNYLYLTPTRLALLRDVADGEVWRRLTDAGRAILDGRPQ